MRRTSIRDDANCRLCYRSEMRDLVLMVRTHLDHGIPVRRIQFEQRKRYADVIIQIAARDKRRPEACKDRPDELLRRCLAVATCHADDWHMKLTAPVAGECTQRFERIPNDDLGKIAMHDPT